MSDDKERPARTVIEWLGISIKPNWTRANWLGSFVGCLIVLLFFGAFLAAGAVIVRTIATAFTPVDEGLRLGSGALITAILGAPFLIWGTVIKQKTVDFQKEGHLTDRISKAVEQLGSEKTSSQIGRSVTIWTGPARVINVADSSLENFKPKPRTIFGERSYQNFHDDIKNEDRSDYYTEVRSWPHQRTVIQWQGTEVDVSPDERIGDEGTWQTFTQTFPNIEVRIGGLLSLERIMQDSFAYDGGRDHERILEILCAYVRENAGLDDPFDYAANALPSSAQRLRIDVEAAMHIIGGTSGTQRNKKPSTGSGPVYRTRFDLKKIDLSGADLRDLSFVNVDFSNSSFRHAKMMKSTFVNVHFNGSNFYKAETQTASADRNTIFSYCLFSGIQSLGIIEQVNRDQVLWCAIKSTDFDHADIQRLLSNEKTIFSDWFSDGSIEYPLQSQNGIAPNWPKHWTKTGLPWDEFIDRWRRWQVNPNRHEAVN